MCMYIYNSAAHMIIKSGHQTVFVFSVLKLDLEWRLLRGIYQKMFACKKILPLKPCVQAGSKDTNGVYFEGTHTLVFFFFFWNKNVRFCGMGFNLN